MGAIDGDTLGPDDDDGGDDDDRLCRSEIHIFDSCRSEIHIYINDICIRFPSRVIGMLIIIRHVEKHNKGREAC